VVHAREPKWPTLEDNNMKALSLATLVFALSVLVASLSAGCADQPKPANSAQNAAGSASSPAAASDKDGGGGW
jgi:hypothetical protein